MKEIISFLSAQKISKKNLALLACGSFFLVILSLAQPEVLKRATNAIVDKKNDELVNALLLAAAASVIFLLLSYGRDIYTILTKNKYEKQISSQLLEKLIDTKIMKLNQRQFGDVSTILIRNVENYVSCMVSAVLELSSGVFSLIVTMAYMLLIEWRLALCVLLYNVVIRFFAVFVEKKMKQNTAAATDAMRISGNYMESLLVNMFTVRIYSNREFLHKYLKKNEQRVMKANWNSFVWSNGFQDFIWAFSKLAEFIIVYGVGSWLILKGLTDISILLTFVFTNDYFTIGINNLSNYITLRAEARANQESLEDILFETDMEEGSDTTFDYDLSMHFKNVSFGLSGKQILNNISFTINPGEKVLLKGESGSGKSTILKLMTGLYRPDSGSIYYGSQDIGEIHLDALAKVYGYITQHSNILEGNILTNIALQENPEMDQLDIILDRLNLAHIKENKPSSLSQGEQQRLNIGRFFYQKKPVFLFGDEIFSNIDENNRRRIIEQFETIYKDVTMVLISHEQVNMKFDRILCVRDGNVIEEVLV